MRSSDLAGRRLALRLLVLLLACALQFHQLGRDLRFHSDEAHFMTFARGAAVKGEWLLPGALDKPPLSIYLSALSMVAVGLTADDDGVLHLDPLTGEFAGRLPNVMLAVMAVAALMRLARRVSWNETTTLLTGLLAACSPFLLAFAATAFSDLSLLFFLLLALLASAQRRFGEAGLALGLAFWCKQQALLFLPLFLILLFDQRITRNARYRFVTMLGGALILLLLWDGARPETSVFVLGAANNTPTAWIPPPSEWPSRLAEWARLGAWLIATPAVSVVLLALALVSGLQGGFSNRWSYPARRAMIACLVFVAGYFAVHTIFAFNLYDRYLLPLLPLATVVTAILLTAMSDGSRFGKRFILTLCGVIVLTTFPALRVGLPLGGDHGERNGILDLASHLNSKPVATVIYDPWLGWELGYYLGVWHDKRRVHYPDPASLAAGARALDEVGDRYLVAPADQVLGDWLDALEAAGFLIDLDYERDRYVVYRLVPLGSALGG